MILSLQGCMAVGKTTAADYLRENVPYVNVSYERNADVIQQVKDRKLDKNKYADYLEIQKLWIRKEIERYREAIKFPCSIMDFGAEEIEFYTINYPKSINQDWEIESALKDELESIRKCMPVRILFLDASEETLRYRKENDPQRTRTFFEHHLNCFMPLKREWFSKKDTVDYLFVDHLSQREVAWKVKEWVDSCIRKYSCVDVPGDVLPPVHRR